MRTQTAVFKKTRIRNTVYLKFAVLINKAVKSTHFCDPGCNKRYCKLKRVHASLTIKEVGTGHTSLNRSEKEDYSADCFLEQLLTSTIKD